MEESLPKMTHEEFLKHTETISQNIKDYIQENNLRIDYICPILRSGAVPAVYLANQLNVVKFAPFQVKHITYSDGRQETKLLFTPFASLEITKTEPVFLVVDGTKAGGMSAQLCIDEIIKHKKQAQILYACIIKSDDAPPLNHSCYESLP